VSPKVIEYIEELIEPSDIYFTKSLDESAFATEKILNKGYRTVFAGGGDGTVMQFINSLARVCPSPENGAAGAAEMRNYLPNLGILSLGTGNAIGRLVSSGSALSDLKVFVSNPSLDVEPLSLVESEGRLFFFGGFGWDAEILNDYRHLKEKYGETRLKPVFQNVGGYFASALGVTVPRKVYKFFKKDNLKVKITVSGGTAYEVGKDGGMGRRFLSSECIYEGDCNACLVGTIPFFGYGMKLLPFAAKHREFMHLRVSRISTIKALANLHSLWKGEYVSDDLNDFYVQHIKVSFNQPVPFEIAGDPMGSREEAEFRINPGFINLLKFI